MTIAWMFLNSKTSHSSLVWHVEEDEEEKEEEDEEMMTMWDGVIPPNKWECVNIGLYFQLFDEVKSF